MVSRSFTVAVERLLRFCKVRGSCKVQLYRREVGGRGGRKKEKEEKRREREERGRLKEKKKPGKRKVQWQTAVNSMTSWGARDSLLA